MIIAELCQNHLGCSDIVRDMIYQCAEAGAKIIKIQSFFAEDLAPEFTEDQDEFDRLKRLELNWKEHKDFVEICKRSNVIPMTSVYTDRYLQEVWNAGFRHVKFGSAQCMNEKLIKTYITAGFKVVISTGGHELSEIPHFGPMFGVLHCVSKYPSRANEADLIRMLEIKKWWPSAPYGLSDHSDPKTNDWDRASKVALFLGATFIERHVTVLPRNETKDGPVSITVDQLKELCRFDKLSFSEKLAEYPDLGLLKSPKSPQEKTLIKKYKTRWVA